MGKLTEKQIAEIKENYDIVDLHDELFNCDYLGKDKNGFDIWQYDSDIKLIDIINKLVYWGGRWDMFLIGYYE